MSNVRTQASIAAGVIGILVFLPFGSLSQTRIPPGLETTDRVRTQIDTLEFKDGGPSAPDALAGNADSKKQIGAGAPKLTRLSKPELLTFDELVQLEKTDDPETKLAARLNQLLQTPFISNEAYLNGAKPNRPSSDALGPFLRATMWNIERGIELDAIKIALTEPNKFGKYIEEKKDPKSKRLTAEELGEVNKQLEILGPTDLFILNEVDDGVT
jgi:hypothetical protein